MDIKTDCIVELYNILKQDTFDKKAFNDFLKTKGGRGFLEHERSRHKGWDKKDLKEELRRVIIDNNYEDEYEFHKIKRDIFQLKEDIDYIEKNYNVIIDSALKEVYKIVPHHMNIKSSIYLYAGGVDGGFTINRRKAFINYGKYIDKRDDFIDILGHELYHCRKISLENRIKYLFRIGFKSERAMYEVVGKLIEEGIACLVQHGPILKKDDPVNALTRRNLLLRKEEFDLLNHILLSIKSNRLDYEKMAKLNIYIIGYHIISTIYNSEGVLILDHWTENLRYAEIIKKYIEICNENNVGSGFTQEVEEWILYRDSLC